MQINKRLIIILTGLASLVFVFYSLPAFAFNELEWRQRVIYKDIEGLRKEADYLIGMRTGEVNSALSDQKKMSLVDEIDGRLDQIGVLIDKYPTFSNKQSKIPFLPERYRKYLELKAVGFDDYEHALDVFREIKRREHTVARLARQAYLVNKALVDNQGSGEQYEQNLKVTVGVAGELIKQTNSLYEKGELTQDLRDYINTNSQNVIDIYQVATGPGALENKEATVKKIGEISRRGSDVDLMAVVEDWHEESGLNKLNQEMKEADSRAIERANNADKYYRDNGLAKDMVSVILSRILVKVYPKNI